MNKPYCYKSYDEYMINKGSDACKQCGFTDECYRDVALKLCHRRNAKWNMKLVNG